MEEQPEGFVSVGLRGSGRVTALCCTGTEQKSCAQMCIGVAVQRKARERRRYEWSGSASAGMVRQLTRIQRALTRIQHAICEGIEKP